MRSEETPSKTLIAADVRRLTLSPERLRASLRRLLQLYSVLCAITSASAAAPTLDHLFPIAVQIGTTNAITAIGKFAPWPPRVWVDAPGIAFKPGTNNGAFTVEVANEAAVGPHLIRLFNDEGATTPRFLIVTAEPQLAEREPNDDYAKPQAIEQFPASINGRLEKSGDVDSFAVSLNAGQTLIASVEAYTLGSPVDAVLRLVDMRGVQQSWNHDDRRTLDPFLAWTAKSAGTYIVQLFGFAYPPDSEVRFTGNARCVYRLHLSRGPYVNHTLPLGVQRGSNTTLQITGWNLSQSHPREVHFDGADLASDAAFAAFHASGFDNTLLLPVGDGPEIMEQEPNDSAAEAQRIDVPSAVTGCTDKAGDEDRFCFDAKKGEKFLLQIQTASLGSSLDPRLRIENTKTAQILTNLDATGTDLNVAWTAPTDGTFVAMVGNLLHRGGADYFYRLSIQRPLPALKLTASETAFTITPGRTNEIKISIKRMHGFDHKLSVAVKGLPDDLMAKPEDVPPKSGDFKIQLIASPDAKPFNGSIQIVATETESGREHTAIAELTSSTLDNGVPGGFSKLLIDTTDRFWLTVLLPQPAKQDAKK